MTTQPSVQAGAQTGLYDALVSHPTEQGQQDFVDGLSPQQREELYVAAEQAQANGQGGIFGGIFAQLAAGSRGRDRSMEQSEQVVREAGPDTEYVQGLSPTDARYEGVPHAELFRYVSTDLDADQVDEISTEYHELSTFFSDSARDLREAMTKSESEWEGEAADEARGFIKGLSTWSDGNSENARVASETLYQQSNAAVTRRTPCRKRSRSAGTRR